MAVFFPHRGAALLFMIWSLHSTAFVQISHNGGGPHHPPPPFVARPGLDVRGWTSNRCCAVDEWRRIPSADSALRMSTQQETKLGSSAAAVTPQEESAAALEAASAAGTAVAKPFASRKLGSFEKMLTQTRDGAGPAEEGIRTLLTPHVWVSNLGDTLCAAVVHGEERAQ